MTRQGTTRREQVQDSADSLRQVNARILGTVLNFVPLRKRRRYGYGYEYGYGYGYGYESKPATEQPKGADEPAAVQKA